MQALRANLPMHRTMMEASRHILKTDGTIGFFRGVTAMAFGAAPAHGVYFAAYEFFKRTLGGDKPGAHPVITSVAGAGATTLADFCQTPLDVVKQRLQLNPQKYGGSVFRCARMVARTEGLQSLWLSYPTTLVMNIPYGATQFTAYELFKRWLTIPRWTDAHGEATIEVHMIAGALAGGVAAGVTTPLDVAKTRLQTQSDTGRIYTTMRQTLATIYRAEGWHGLFAGMKPRVLFFMPSSAICWVTYEGVKKFMNSFLGATA